MCFAPQRRALFRHLNFEKWSEPGVFCTFWLQNLLCATTACTFSTSQLPKVLRTWGVFCTFWDRNVLRATTVHFFDISTSKSGPRMLCLVHFNFEMCFAPQRRALFRHLNFQKWSENGVFCTFWLRKTACTFSTSQLPKVLRTWVVFCTFWDRNVLRATKACTFSTSQLPKVVRECCVLYILRLKCASRHNGVHFFDISTSKSGPRMVCSVHFDFEMCFGPQRRALFRHLNFQKCSEREVFLAFSLANVLRAITVCTFSSLIWPNGSAPAALASLLFDPPEPQIIGKTECFATFPPFRASELLSSDSFSSLIFSLLLFSSLWLFPSLLFICPYCRKFDF